MSFGDIVEGHDVPTETEEQVRAEGDKSPEGKLDPRDISELHSRQYKICRT